MNKLLRTTLLIFVLTVAGCTPSIQPVENGVEVVFFIPALDENNGGNGESGVGEREFQCEGELAAPLKELGVESEGQLWIPGQIILTGDEGALSEVQDAFGLEPVSLEAENYAGFDFLDPEQYAESIAEIEEIFEINLLESQTRLFEIPPGCMVYEILQQINAGEFRVHGEPNYYVEIAGSSLCGDPYTVGGSPYTVGGSPGSGLKLGPDHAAFSGQWAFDWVATALGGADVPQEPDGNAASSVIGVFDSAPFSGDQTVTVPAGVINSAPFTFEVRDRTSLLTPISSGVEVENRHQHGLFVTGLIHAIEPDSQIVLYRILNDEGCGSLFALDSALREFLDNFGSEPEPSIVNLSLGTYVPPVGDDSVLIEQLLSLFGPTRLIDNQGQNQVIAAAGNDSAASTVAAAPENPAAYTHVTGVGALDETELLACYSNMGDTDAPGGGADCAAARDEVCDSEIISIVMMESGDFEYGCWSGTSFATPVISGLAAQGIGP